METTKTPTKQPLTIKTFMAREDVVENIKKHLGEKTQGFITSVLQVSNQSEMLKKCDPASIYNAAMTAAILDLPLNNALGFSYIIPFGNQAVFCLGYKGMIQLCQRTGQYKNISATPVYEGQLLSSDPLRGCKFDFSKKGTKIIGYCAYFELTSGFQKDKYMSKEEIATHAKKYSKTYGKTGSAWTTNENEMAQKTVLRLLISKFGPMSIDVQRADALDELIGDKPAPSEFVDAVYAETDVEREKLTLAIDAENSTDGLAVLKMQIGTDDYLDLQDAIDKKIEKLNSAKKK